MSPEAFDRVLVVDFGAQYAQLIARRVREAHVYSEIVPRTMPLAEMLAKQPLGIILSGGPASVHVDDAPQLDPAIYAAGIPVLGICYGAQLVAQQLGGEVGRTGSGEYGRTELTRTPGVASVLLGDMPAEQVVWMSHGDAIAEAPPGFVVTASSPGAPVAALEDRERAIYGVQFHPEVLPHRARPGRCSRPSCSTCATAGPRGRTRRSSSGGRRGARAGRLRARDLRAVGWRRLRGRRGARAQGDRRPAHLRVRRHRLVATNEAEQVEETFRRQFHIDLVHVKAADRFLGALDDVIDPERKRKIIGETFIRVFEEAAADLSDARFLVQGTLYPDIVESGGADNAVIKSHHNVGGLPDDMNFELVEPLRHLFKDEVRAVGEELGLPEEIVWRQPFPGPGLAVRIIGTITPERLEILRQADAIVVEEIRRAGLYREIWQSFAVLPAVRTVGVMGDGRTYEYPIIIRAVTSEDAMTADWARLPGRRARAHGVADHQRGARRQPGRLRHHQQAPRHHRMGVVAR